MEYLYIIGGIIILILILFSRNDKQHKTTTLTFPSPPQKEDEVTPKEVIVTKTSVEQARMNRYGYFANLRQEEILDHQAKNHQYKERELQLTEKDLTQYEKAIELQTTSKSLLYLQKDIELSAKETSLSQQKINLTAQSLFLDIQKDKLEVGIKWLEIEHKGLDVKRQGLENILGRIDIETSRTEVNKQSLIILEDRLKLEEQRAILNVQAKEIALDNQILQHHSDKLSFQEERAIKHIEDKETQLNFIKQRFGLTQQEEVLKLQKTRQELTEYTFNEAYQAKMEWLKIKDALAKIDKAKTELLFDRRDVELERKYNGIKNKQEWLENEKVFNRTTVANRYYENILEKTKLQEWSNNLQLEEINRKWNTMEFIQKRWGLDGYNYPVMKELRNANYTPDTREYLELFRK